MRYGIFGDFHGADLRPLAGAAAAADVNALVCLGDFDLTKTIHQFLEIRRWATDKGYPVYEVPGNHDQAMLNRIDIYSPNFKDYEKTYEQLCDELHSEVEAKNYIRSLLDGGTRSEFWLGDDIHKGRVLAIHGGLADRFDMWTSAYLGDLSDLWNRIESTADYRANFRTMKKLNYRIMIRSHDHEPVYACQEMRQEPREERGFAKISELFSLNRIKKIAGEGRFMLHDDKRYIINPGAVCDGHWAILDVNDKTFLEFRTL